MRNLWSNSSGILSVEMLESVLSSNNTTDVITSNLIKLLKTFLSK